VFDEHLNVKLADRSNNRLIAEATIKTDRLDAKRLVHMIHAGMLAESYVPREEIRTLCDIVRTRKGFLLPAPTDPSLLKSINTNVVFISDGTFNLSVLVAPIDISRPVTVAECVQSVTKYSPE